MSNPRKILLAISGSIAAYRAADIASELIKLGHEVKCVLTHGASEFVTPLTLETLSRNPVYDRLWGPGISGTEHIRLARWPDLIVFAPATAHLIAKLSLGLADDLVTTIALATEAPWMIAPAMNTVMWNNPTTQDHLQRLRTRGVHIVAPDSGELACGEIGTGKLAQPKIIVQEILEYSLGRKQDLVGTQVLITAGPTISRIDSVRYLTNGSTGKMGAALAEVALARGAHVRYVLGVDKGVVRPVAPPGAAARLKVIEVQTAEEMAQASLLELPESHGVIATAAVLDYRVESPSPTKLKRSTEPLALALTPSTDVLATLRQHAREGQWFVGFAAEMGDIETKGRAKLERKSLDLIFVNEVAESFGHDTNAGLILRKSHPTAEAIPTMSKRELAHRLWDAISDQCIVESTL